MSLGCLNFNHSRAFFCLHISFNKPPIHSKILDRFSLGRVPENSELVREGKQSQILKINNEMYCRKIRIDKGLIINMMKYKKIDKSIDTN